jgi:glycosyltransferase involved in cell wall biosynthesis
MNPDVASDRVSVSAHTEGTKVAIPSVGIVIAAYNAARFLGATLESIRRQSFSNWECVIVDDGSTDHTSAVAQTFVASDRRFRAYRQTNSGPCVARNFGFSRLRNSHEFITFMDADDLWEQDCLVILVDELLRNPDMVGAHALGEFIDSNGNDLMPGAFSSLGRQRSGCKGGKIRDWPLEMPSTFESIITSSVVFPPGLILTRRKIFETVGLFDNAMRYAEDWDLLIRVARQGDLSFINRVLLRYRRHDSNVGTGTRVAKACADVRRKAFFATENSHLQRLLLRDMWHAAQRDLIRDRVERTGQLLGRGHPIEAAVMAMRIPFIAWRYLRGRPTRA